MQGDIVQTWTKCTVHIVCTIEHNTYVRWHWYMHRCTPGFMMVSCPVASMSTVSSAPLLRLQNDCRCFGAKSFFLCLSSVYWLTKGQRKGVSRANIPIGAQFYEKSAKKAKSGSPYSRLLRTFIIHIIWLGRELLELALHERQWPKVWLQL